MATVSSSIDILINKIDELINSIDKLDRSNRYSYRNKGKGKDGLDDYYYNPFNKSTNNAGESYSDIMKRVQKAEQERDAEMSSVEKKLRRAQINRGMSKAADKQLKWDNEIEKWEAEKRRLEEKPAKIVEEAKSGAVYDLTGGRSGKFVELSQKMQRMGNAMDVLSKGNGPISTLGKKFTGLGKLTAKAAGPIGFLLEGIRLLGEGLKATAEADAELQRIQNERNTAQTNRNIERSKVDAESLIDSLEIETAKGLAVLNTEGSITLGQQNIANMESMAQLQTRNDSITKGFNPTAWEALNRDIDIRAAQEKLNVMALTERDKTERANELRDIEFAGREWSRDIRKQQIDQDLREKETELDIQDRNYTREHAYSTAATRFAGSRTDADAVYNPGGRDYNKATDGGNATSANSTNIGVATTIGAVESLPIVGGVLSDHISPYVDAAYTKADTVARKKLTNERNYLNAQETAIENTTKFANALKSSGNQILDTTADLFKQIADQAIDARAQQEKTYAQFSHDVEQWALNFDKMMRHSAAGKGITTREQNTQYGAFMNQTTQTLAHNWGLDVEEIMQMQDDYGKNSGRSLIANETDMNKAAAMGKYLGDNNLAVELASSTEIFNMGMSNTMDLMWDMSKKVNKMGLDGRKYMKDMVNNLKMAQKYRFANGVKGMMEMAKWAQNTRFNMSNLSNMLEKIQDGGLEDLITTGAGIQVLGGNFAMGADPLAMAWEAYNDPAALAQRQASMMKGIGKFNSKSGEVEFNMVDQQRLRQFSKLTGQDYEDVLNQRRQAVKSKEMGQFVNSELDESQRANVINKAYYKDGEWMVNDLYGNEMRVKDVNTNNVGNVQADTHEGIVEQDLQHIVSYTDKEHGLSVEEMAKFAQAITSLGDLEENQQKRYEAQSRNFNDHFNENLGTVRDNIVAATNAFEEQLHTDKKDPIGTMVDSLSNIESILQKDILPAIGKAAADMENEMKSTAVNGSDKTTDIAEAIVNGFTKAGYSEKDVNKLKKIANGEYGTDEFNKTFDDIVGNGWSTRDEWFYNLPESQQTLIKDNPKAFYKALREMNQSGANNVGNRHLDALQYVKKEVNIEPPKSGFAVQADMAFKDGMASSDSTPMAVSASKVVPIHDGAVAKSDPKDHAIFAKMGGPFDKLFNGVFGKIDDVHNILSDKDTPLVSRGVGKFNPKTGEACLSIGDQMRLQQLSKMSPKPYDPFKGLQVNDTQLMNGQIGKEGRSLSINPIRIEMSGTLELTSNNHSIDIMKELQNNPTLLREITRLISDNISKTLNGGRHVYNGGDLVTFR